MIASGRETFFTFLVMLITLFAAAQFDLPNNPARRIVQETYRLAGGVVGRLMLGGRPA